MNGFYLAIGKQGSGKTVFITKLLVNDLEKKDRPVFSNYTLKGINYEHITLEYVLNKLDEEHTYFNNSILLFDEIHLYLDSLDFMRKNNRRLQTFFSQLRKRNILLLATTQYIMNVDIRIRRQCMNVFEMQHVFEDLFIVTTHEIDGYFTREISEVKMMLDDYYKYYDTNELVIE